MSAAAVLAIGIGVELALITSYAVTHIVQIPSTAVMKRIRWALRWGIVALSFSVVSYFALQEVIKLVVYYFSWLSSIYTAIWQIFIYI